MKDVEERGMFNYDGELLIPMGRIYNELLNNIHYVENYKSDLLISIDELKRKVEEFNLGDNEIEVWLGYRQNGVDHFDYIKNELLNVTSDNIRLNEYKNHYYRKLFKITIVPKDNEVVATLSEKTEVDFYIEQKKKAGIL